MKYFLIVLGTVLWLLPARADAALEMDLFARIPIQHEGRIKPMDSFARSELRRLTGQEKFNGSPAIDWLAMSVFSPDAAMQQDFFSVASRAVRQQLQLPDGKKYFSATEILAALEAKKELILSLMQTAPEKLTGEQQALLQLAGTASHYLDLVSSLAVVLPFGDDQIAYLDIAQSEQDITARLKKLLQRKGKNISAYSEDDIKLSRTGMELDRIKNSGSNSTIFRIVPPQWQNIQEWQTPFSVLQDSRDSRSLGYLKDWQKLADAYRSRNEAAWQLAAKETLSASRAMADFTPQKIVQLRLETLYQAYKPFKIAELFYGLALICFACSFVPKLKIPAVRLLPRFCEAGMFFHTVGIAARVFILERPPVGTLYESLLFVSLIVAALSYVINLKTTLSWHRFTGFAVALFLLVISPAFYSGDSLEVLIAVLNTNFWLATHVICITAAYGVCLVAAAFAHLILLQQCFRAGNTFRHEQTLRKILLGALLLTACGTVLGGIWADQSWGRFWGWDPKENGALLIVLWITWILHGRMSGNIKGIYFIAGTAFLSVIVALSWFGVNLLSTGLHAYGFISGIAYGLALFCSIEILFIVFCLWKRHAQSHLA